MAEAREFVRHTQCLQVPEVRFLGWDEPSETEVQDAAERLLSAEPQCRYVRGVVEARNPESHPEAAKYIAAFVAEFAQTSLSGECPVDPPVRGPFGEAEIWLKPGSRPVSVAPYRIDGERKAAWTNLVDRAVSAGKLEPGVSSWNTPSFPVPKKRPGEYRLVQDFRPLNEATEKDGHPLPRIGDILRKQGRHRMWSVLDLVDGYHQMPLREDHRHYTCMATPRGTMQWKVQVMGLKNAGAQFQRMMEWVLRGVENADPYIDDIIIGSSGETEEVLMRNHAQDVTRVLRILAEQRLVSCPRKSHFFMREVEFCGHILRDGTRSPAPGKLLPIQKWECPKR